MIGLYLAVMSLVRRPAIALVPALAIAGCIIPILVIWSIKAGYVDGLMRQIEHNPHILEIRLRGDKTLSMQDIEAMKAIPGTGYLEPTTRGLAVRVFVGRVGDRRQVDASLLPSSQGDPLVPNGVTPTPTSILVSQDLAAQAGLKEGEQAEIRSIRTGGDEILRIPVKVDRIVDPSLLAGKRLLVHPTIILEVEDFVDGYAVPAYGIQGKALDERHRAFANARVYASSLYDVGNIAKGLKDLGHEPETDDTTIRFVLTLQSATSFIVLVFAAILLTGASITMWGALSQSLLPQRRVVGLFRLMGGTRLHVLVFVTVLTVTVVVVAMALAWSGYLLISHMINNASIDMAVMGQISAIPDDQVVLAAMIASCLAVILGFIFTLIYFSGQAKGALNHDS